MSVDEGARTQTVRQELFGPDKRAVTVGLVLLISLFAFENMGVGTAMPALVADLADTASYAWPFVTFIAATVVGTVAAGRWCDTRGPTAMLLGGPAVFGLGLVVAGTAPVFGQLLAGRVLQGFGAGAIGVSVYVLIALVYSQDARPAVFALVSAAWVAPALIGPPVAGFVTETWSWHWVFLGLVPLVLVAVALVLPATRGLGPPDSPRPGSLSRERSDRVEGRRGLLAASVVAAVGVAALSWAGQRVDDLPVASGVVAVVALALLALAFPRLVPAGTFRARPGVATMVLSRALVSGAFFTSVSYLPLTLTKVHHWSLTAAGAPLIVGSLAWSAASAWQGQRPDLDRRVLLRAGFACVATGVAGLWLVTPAWGLPWLAFLVLPVAGTGMGLAFSSLSYLLLADSEPAEVGFNSSSAQLADQLAQATFVGLGGALLAVVGGPATAIPVLLVALVALALTGVVVNRPR